MTDIKTVREVLEKSRKGHFHVNGDSWYSCAAHPECADDDDRVKSCDGKCDCGADRHNEMIGEALAALDRIEAKHTAHEDYTDGVDVFKYIREKQELGHFTHPAIVELVDMATAQTVGDDEAREVHEYLADKYFIVKNGLYYRPNAQGYTTNPNSAGLYTLLETQKHLSGCSELTIKPAYRIRAGTAPKNVEELIHAVGSYALKKGEEWRIGEGAEIMDAYQAAVDTAQAEGDK